MDETTPTPHEESEARADGENAAQGESPSGEHVLLVAGKTVYLVGTAHISARSVEEVRDVIARVKPDTVCVELDEARHKSLVDQQAWRNMDLVQVIRRKQATLLLAHLIMSAFQRRLGEHLGIRPGAEMIQAVESAAEHGAELVLADRDIRITLRRTWAHLRLWDKAKLIMQFMGGLVTQSSITAEEIEQLKQKDMLSQVMEGFAKAFPRAKRILIDERDTWLADHIITAPGEKIVSVVGAGHVPGILRHLKEHSSPVPLDPLSRVPPPSPLLRWLQWLIPLAVVGLIVYGFVSVDSQVSLEMVKVWVLANGVLSALGAALAMGHPLTILAAFLAAPLTSLNPMVAAGWVSGLVEAVVRRPRVSDFEKLPDDIVTIKGFWRNAITRILLVVAFSNLGSAIGTLVGIPLMTRLL
ncbi:MAG: TraB/GumN family protein [Deltaproteobacteria bacterium]|nr:TraB/GumN family protein [Deltaproteobacteria bacterium]